MRTLTSALVIVFMCIALIGTIVTASAQGTATPSSQSATVTGTVTDESGAPIAGARIELRGITPKTVVSDAAGNFTASGLTAGFYTVSASKPGFTTAVQNDVALFSGQTTTLAIQMGAVTFTSLRTIASVRTSAHALNTTPASVNVVTTSTFINQAQPQVTRVLSQVPGVQISFPSSVNAAAPGAITVPNIRDATSYETASLIDGHPISVGQYGDNVTTFLNAFMFGSMEVVKGPGADAPEVNNAIGGTTNFRTKDPTATPFRQLLVGFDNHGGTLTNLEASDTVGKLGFVVDLATNNNPSAMNGKPVYYSPVNPTGGVLNGGNLGDPDQSNGDPVGNTQSFLPLKPQLLACCWTLDGSMNQTAELVKLRYAVSPVTRLTVSYLGGQTTADQNGNTGNLYNAIFSPGAGYTGSLAAGTPVQYAYLYAGATQGEFSNEPIYQAEIASAIGNDSVAARYYNALVTRYQWGGTNPAGYDYNNVTLFGTSSGDPTQGYLNQNFNGTPALVQYFDYYTEPEIDKLQGESFEYQHPLGANDLLTFSADWTAAQSTDYSVFSGPFYSFNLPPGTHQQLGTYLLRGRFLFGPKLSATVANYFNTYSTTYPLTCNPDCNTQAAAQFGKGVVFGTTTNTHDDPRLGLVYRPSAWSAVRLAMGSMIAPPYMGLLSGLSSTPFLSSNPLFATESVANSNLKPETGFGYDLGGDLQLPKQQIAITGDIYLTNLYNRFFGQTVPTGLTCAQVTCEPGNITSPGIQILNQTNVNISNARFEGIELGMSRQPAVGFGFNVSGALNRGYYYNLPPYFYCSLGPNQTSSNGGPNGCIPANYDQNLNVISGQNTNGTAVGIGGLSYNGNMRIPYAQGNAEINYTFPNQMYVSIGETYYGKNNSLDEPPFGIGYATVRVPISRGLAVQVSGDNIFNAYPGYMAVYGAGVPIDLANGGTAATNGNQLGPATWRFMIMTRP